MFAGHMGHGVHRGSDGSTSGSSGRPGARGGSHTGMDAPIGLSSRVRPSGSQEPAHERTDPTDQYSQRYTRRRSLRTMRLIDEDDDDEVPASPLAAARPHTPPPEAYPEGETMAYMEQILDECPLPPPLPPRGGNILTRQTPLTKHDNDLFHHTTDRLCLVPPNNVHNYCLIWTGCMVNMTEWYVIAVC